MRAGTREIHVGLSRRSPNRLEVFVGAETVITLSPNEARAFARMLTRIADKLEVEILYDELKEINA